MTKNILSKECYILKFTADERSKLIRFCMITPPIIDAINFMLDHMDDVISIFKKMKAVEPYIKQWRDLEKPISNIFDKIKKVENIEKE